MSGDEQKEQDEQDAQNGRSKQSSYRDQAMQPGREEGLREWEC
jgi:hypothetical protein